LPREFFEHERIVRAQAVVLQDGVCGVASSFTPPVFNCIRAVVLPYLPQGPFRRRAEREPSRSVV
jgi:tRNA U34 5-methylaminomethyl-2-thiouridine-forming methyltransferase MnmC